MQARVGENLWRLARKHDIKLSSGLRKWLHCRGRGFCGGCRVRIDGDAAATNERWTWEELRFADTDVRLACQCEVRGDLKVTTQP